jgi:putative lipoprotein
VRTPGGAEEIAEAPAEEETESPAEEAGAEASVSGSVTYEDDVALPADALLTVQIQDVSSADGIAKVVGEEVIAVGGLQVPIPYEVAYDTAEIDEQFTYSMRARIEDSAGTLLFTNDAAVPVITRGNPTSGVEIGTVQVHSAASDAELGQSGVDFEVDADSAVEATEDAGSFSTLLEGLEAAGLSDALSQVDGEYTLFAPTDEAFASLPPGIFAGWQANPQEFANILSNLVVEGRYDPEDLVDGLVLRSVVGTNIGITRDGEMININGVPVIDAAEAGESVVYALPQVILPPLPAGVSAPIIDASGVPFFIGEILTVVGTAEPDERIVLAIDEERFGDIATVQEDGTWLIQGEINQGIHSIIAYMIDRSGLVRGISQEVILAVP